MTVFLVTSVFMLGIVLAMSVGVILSGRRLRGSCGGVGNSCACKEQGVAEGRGCAVRAAP